MFDDQAQRAIERIAKQYDWPGAALLAVAEVESGGKAFALVNPLGNSTKPSNGRDVGMRACTSSARIAELRFVEIVTGHGHAADIDVPLLAASSLVDGRLHVMGWPPPPIRHQWVTNLKE